MHRCDGSGCDRVCFLFNLRTPLALECVFGDASVAGDAGAVAGAVGSGGAGDAVGGGGERGGI